MLQIQNTETYRPELAAPLQENISEQEKFLTLKAVIDAGYNSPIVSKEQMQRNFEANSQRLKSLGL